VSEDEIAEGGEFLVAGGEQFPRCDCVQNREALRLACRDSVFAFGVPLKPEGWVMGPIFAPDSLHEVMGGSESAETGVDLEGRHEITGWRFRGRVRQKPIGN
jgi:hypothetical protein